MQSSSLEMNMELPSTSNNIEPTTNSIIISMNSNLNLLLLNLKKSIELWFLSEDDETYINLHNSIKIILLNGLKLEVINDSYQNLANDLNWLQATTTLNIYSNNDHIINKSVKISIFKYDYLSLWILQSLHNNTICSSLQLFYNDKELLQNYYNNLSFICQEKYSNALFICLSAYELKQSSLLSQIDLELLQELPIFTSKHRRSSSHPQFSISIIPNINKSNTSLKKTGKQESTLKCLKDIDGNQVKKIYMRDWKSLPNIREITPYQRPRSKTISQPIIRRRRKLSKPKITLKSSIIANIESEKSSTSSESNRTNIDEKISNLERDLEQAKSNERKSKENYEEIKIYVDQNYDYNKPYGTPKTPSSSSSLRTNSIKNYSPINNFLSNLFSTTPKHSGNESDRAGTSYQTDSFLGSWSNGVWGEKISKPHVNFDDIIASQMSAGNNDSSLNGQALGNDQSTLTAFLQSNPFSRNTVADLERENAHFKISEAIISIIENIKWSKFIDTENSNSLKKDKDKDDVNIVKIENLVVNGKETSELNTNKLKTELDEGIETGTSYLDEPQTISVEPDNCVAVEALENEYTASAEWGNSRNILSAESVGLSLISKFNDKQLPKFSELKWLVSEDDAPQQMLPIPLNGSKGNSPERNIHSITVGTKDWAPPRKQIIFTNHTPITRRQQMQKQNYRCSGCSMKVAEAYISRYRYCTYFGKYFCTGCHRNHLSEIPAKILHRWDFSLHPISVFAYRLLEQIWNYPIFSLSDVAPFLYKRVKLLSIAKHRREQLKFIKDFITTCRFVKTESLLFNELPSYITSDTDIWSISDLIDIKNRNLQKRIERIIEQSEKHVFNCVLCVARGFICELCRENYIIYPWQSKINRCNKCGSCYHQNCWRNNPNCIKCGRLEAREQIVKS